eukprot:scaffold254808_cov26-Tisochrysis_lutea.AAC.1
MQSFAHRQCQPRGSAGNKLRGSPTVHRAAQPSRCLAASAAAEQPAVATQGASAAPSNDPLMLRALRGEAVERPPVWMMRQAGRYMKVYQELVKKHPSFRERSERVDLSVEITLQPWHAFKPDGVVLFSDILTPLPGVTDSALPECTYLAGMNISFDIGQGTGPVIYEPIRTMEHKALLG